jgi:creatinine amidohydrolase/Fe(II)-dependent formamide hydrolase-like protein
VNATNLLRAEELRYPEIKAFDPERTICFVPVSALEVHGPHLPLGMDMFMARWLAEETGRLFAEAHPDWAVVIYMPLTLGTDELPLAGSMHVTQRELYRVLLDHGRSLAEAGYRYVVVTNGHGGPRHASALEAACQAVSRRHGIEMFTPAIAVLHALVSGKRFDRLEEILGRPLTEEEHAGFLHGEHAATMETSFILAERPELVDSVYRELKRDAPPRFGPFLTVGRLLVSLLSRDGDPERRARLDEAVDGLAGGIGWFLNARYGYGGPEVTYEGDPAAASAELGQALRQLVVEDCLAIVESVTSGQRRAEEVRSIASDAVIIHPLFWRRLALGMAILAGLVLALSRRRAPRR